jgi:hypothetical protein
MHIAEEVISLLSMWADYAEPEPETYRDFTHLEVAYLQLDLLKAIEMLKLAAGPTIES